MTEVPEYLLRRSRERREALGLAPKGEAGTTGGAADAPPGDAPAAAPAAAAAAPAPAEAAAPAPVATETLPAYIPDTGPRSGIPVWMMPVILILPLWAIVYLGAFGEKRAAGPLSPAAVYQKGGCGGCHGMRGEGGVGPKVGAGESKITFPNEADHIAWVETGSVTKRGQPYGDANRPGGQRIAQTGGMPGFKGQLTDAEIRAVVQYERDQL